MVHLGDAGAPRRFGKVSLLEMAPPLHPDTLPFELPVARYLEETLSGMIGSPLPNDEESETSANWRRLKKLLSSPPAREVCSALAWLAIGIIFELFDDRESPDLLREALSSGWQQLTLALGSKGRDWLLDALPTSFCQTIYRLMVDAFPPDYGLLTKQPSHVLDKIGTIVHFEITGFQVTMRTLRDLRRRLYRAPILEHPYLDLLAARRAEARREKLAGSSSGGAPLSFGSLGGQPLEETQLEHILERRIEEAAAAAKRPGGRLPPLCPEELSADRHLNIAASGEALFMQHLQRVNPEAAKMEELDAMLRAGDPAAEGARSPNAEAQSGSPKALRMSKSLNLKCESASERKRLEALLAAKLEAPLPKAYLAKPLHTSGVSPMLSRVMPGGSAKSESVTLKMRQPTEQFLPKLAPAAASPAPASPAPAMSRTSSASSEMEPMSPMMSMRRQTSRRMTRTNSKAMRGLPRLPEVSIEASSGRVQRQTVLKRIDDELEGFQKRTFEQYKKDYDIVTGQKRTRLDAERLREEEKSTLQRHQALLGSRSAPTLFGARGPAGELDSRRDGAAANAARRPAAPPAYGGADAAVEHAPSGGGRPWNELTSVH